MIWILDYNASTPNFDLRLLGHLSYAHQMPKSERCVHCLVELEEATRDHVFPKSWYPSSTPSDVQRWTVPSCGSCNNRLGSAERSLLIPFGLAIGPSDPAGSGLSAKALRTLGVGTPELSDSEAKARKRQRARVASEMKLVTEEVLGSVLPGLGPHAWFPRDSQFTLPVDRAALTAVIEKMVKGCEYKIAHRYVEPPYRIQVNFPKPPHGDNARATHAGLLRESGSLGPGFYYERYVWSDQVMFFFDFWQRLAVIAFVYGPDVAAPASLTRPADQS